eukprot:3716902-Alexandrium_andersonii.AAC.1
MAGFPAGTRLLVYYDGDDVHHERIVLAHVRDSLHYIVTPDGDVYPETLAVPPLSSLLELGPGRA